MNIDNSKLLIALLDALPLCIYWKNSKSTLIGCNLIQAKLLGYSDPRDAVGKTDYDFYTKDKADSIIKNDKKVFATGITLEAREKVQSGNNELMMLSMKKLVHLNNGEKILVGISFDITKEYMLECKIKSSQEEIVKKNEELKYALEKASLAVKTHTTIFENMKHNLITATSDIKLALEYILDNKMSMEEAKEFIIDAKSGADSLHNHIKDILDLVLSKEGIPPVISAPVNLIDIANRVKNMFMAGIAVKKINFHFDVSSVPKLVRCDNYRIERIMISLLGNAVKFSKNGGNIWFSIKLINESKDDYVIAITVKDTGAGMNKDEVLQIYEPFYRGTPAYQTRIKNTGNGVGLAIVKQYVKQIEGQIDCQSNLGKGTTFIVGFKAQKSILPKEIIAEAMN